MAKIKDRREFMTKQEQILMAGMARTHDTCLAKTGRMRPGKTAQDHARKRGARIED